MVSAYYRLKGVCDVLSGHFASLRLPIIILFPQALRKSALPNLGRGQEEDGKHQFSRAEESSSSSSSKDGLNSLQSRNPCVP